MRYHQAGFNDHRRQIPRDEPSKDTAGNVVLPRQPQATNSCPRAKYTTTIPVRCMRKAVALAIWRAQVMLTGEGGAQLVVEYLPFQLWKFPVQDVQQSHRKCRLQLFVIRAPLLDVEMFPLLETFQLRTVGDDVASAHARIPGRPRWILRRWEGDEDSWQRGGLVGGVRSACPVVVEARAAPPVGGWKFLLSQDNEKLQVLHAWRYGGQLLHSVLHARRAPRQQLAESSPRPYCADDTNARPHLKATLHPDADCTVVLDKNIAHGRLDKNLAAFPRDSLAVASRNLPAASDGITTSGEKVISHHRKGSKRQLTGRQPHVAEAICDAAEEPLGTAQALQHLQSGSVRLPHVSRRQSRQPRVQTCRQETLQHPCDEEQACGSLLPGHCSKEPVNR
mmetsp:Transcript_9201/g.25731  ORF Transcript_9201/g.25731 Transcript_9201/m.25731 type:complete len:393 (-) Transcript_9201:592-1770(-)